MREQPLVVSDQWMSLKLGRTILKATICASLTKRAILCMNLLPTCNSDLASNSFDHKIGRDSQTNLEFFNAR